MYTRLKFYASMLSNNKTIEQLENITKDDIPYVGESFYTLARFFAEKFPVPPGFVISSMGFNQYIDLTDIRKYYEMSRNDDDRLDIIDAIDASALPGKLQNEINEAYSKISGFTDAYVNLRAIVLSEDLEEIYTNKYAVYDVKGEIELINSIKDLYREILSQNLDKVDDFFFGKLMIVILVQKAINSEASGIMFTTDIVTKDKSKLVIEAAFGLESGISLEGIIPDQYIINKEDDEILQKHISTQEFMIVRQMGSKNGTQKIPISAAWQKRQKLNDKHILVLAKIGKIIEEELNEPQQINWLYESGKIWINFIASTNNKQLDLSDSTEISLEKKVENLVLSSSQKEAQVVQAQSQSQKELFVDIVFDESNKENASNDSFNQNNLNITKTNMDHNQKQKFKKEPLLEGMHSAGGEAQGKITFDHVNAQENNILVLKGDEDISSTLKVSGFIIEDDSEILAERLFEYFKVPVITGVPLAGKILKEGEEIAINGENGHIYELVPFNQFIDHKVTKIDNHILGDSFLGSEPSKAVLESQEELEVNVNRTAEILDTKGNETETGINFQNEIDKSYSKNTNLNNHQGTKVNKSDKSKKPESQTSHESFLFQNKDISKLLDLVEEDQNTIRVEEKELNEVNVRGISDEEQMKLWGKSLEKILSVSKKVPPSTAANALQHVVEETKEIESKTKEFAFDTEERYISGINQEKSPSTYHNHYIPTATKVYVQLIDETLDKELQNFDGIVFSSTQDIETYLKYLEETLENSYSKEVLAVCPPYEESALSRFFDGIYFLRNKGYKNLSLILPDYRNKKEIIEFKKLMTACGLRRSSTFQIYANVSRTINVFRITELNEAIIDGVYVDLFRLKMNMLGVEKLTASTRYVEGMKNLVSYIYENLKFDGKTLVNISAFGYPQRVVNHLFKFGFWGLVCEQSSADKIKKYVSRVEQETILKAKDGSNIKRMTRTKRYL